jgi:hypothetical protein
MGDELLFPTTGLLDSGRRLKRMEEKLEFWRVRQPLIIADSLEKRILNLGNQIHNTPFLPGIIRLLTCSIFSFFYLS